MIVACYRVAEAPPTDIVRLSSGTGVGHRIGEKGAAADNLRKFDYINFGAGDACDLLISEKGAVPI